MNRTTRTIWNKNFEFRKERSNKKMDFNIILRDPGAI